MAEKKQFRVKPVGWFSLIALAFIVNFTVVFQFEVYLNTDNHIHNIVYVSIGIMWAIVAFVHYVFNEWTMRFTAYCCLATIATVPLDHGQFFVDMLTRLVMLYLLDFIVFVWSKYESLPPKG